MATGVGVVLRRVSGGEGRAARSRGRTPRSGIAKEANAAVREKQRSGEFKESIELAFDVLRRNPARSFLTILGIVIGVSTIIAIGAVVTGLNSGVLSQIENLGSNTSHLLPVLLRHAGAAAGGRASAEGAEIGMGRRGLALLPHVLAAAILPARIQNLNFGSGYSSASAGGTFA